jgi:hypothetical protein
MLCMLPHFQRLTFMLLNPVLVACAVALKDLALSFLSLSFSALLILDLACSVGV